MVRPLLNPSVTPPTATTPGVQVSKLKSVRWVRVLHLRAWARSSLNIYSELLELTASVRSSPASASPAVAFDFISCFVGFGVRPVMRICRLGRMLAAKSGKKKSSKLGRLVQSDCPKRWSYLQSRKSRLNSQLIYLLAMGLVYLIKVAPNCKFKPWLNYITHVCH